LPSFYGTIQNRPGLFGEQAQETIEVSFEDVERDAKSEGKDNGERIGGFIETYGWLITIDKLAGGDPLKYDYFYRLPVQQFLNLVSFHKSKNEYETELEEQRSRSLHKNIDNG
jgi:hypothetical protein